MAIKSSPAEMSVPASPPIFNPSRTDEVEFAEYRANAIARDIEQRREEQRPPHPQEHEVMSEAMAYAWMLLSARRWSRTDVLDLEKRLWGNK